MMDSPGRIYLRVEGNNLVSHSGEHQTIIENWIAEFERNRRSFVYPKETICGFSYFFLVCGLLLVILQIVLSSVQHASIPSLLGSGIWIGLLCIGAGVAGLYSAQKKTSANLLDFMVLTTIINMFSALIVILNTVGLEIYSKLCSTDKAKLWIGECDETTVALQGTLIFLNVVLFVLSSCCGGFICRTLDSTFQIRTPPLVIYHTTKPAEEALETEEQQVSMLGKEKKNKGPKKSEQRGDVHSE